MPITRTMGHVLNNLVVVLRGPYIPLIYQTNLTYFVLYFIYIYLYIYIYIVHQVLSSDFRGIYLG